MQLQAYYGSGSLGLQGLGMLITGLLLESWAGLELLANRGRKDSELIVHDLETTIREPVPGDVLVGQAS